jgi:uncharacterized LabA/DUF88 family protein
LKTNVYVDGFNLYYGALKGTKYKWLDLMQMCQLLLPQNTIHCIKYFTARVNARPNNPDQPVRQQAYIRALQTLPNLRVVFGHFLTSEVMMPVAYPVQGQPRYIKVIKTEEKGSDVNLATHLLNDGYKKDYDIAVVITNDSDLLEPIRIVRQELGLRVGILNPHKRPSRALLPHVMFIKQIRVGVLAQSQFPNTLTDANGTFSKPRGW